MALTDSRLGPGTLQISTSDFEDQLTNVRLVPATDEIDGTPTLGIPEPSPETQDAKWTLEGTAVQDWGSETGFIEFCRAHHGTSYAFTWVPDSAVDLTYSGTLVVKALEIGGDVAVQTTTDFSFRVIGQPTVTYL